MGESEKAVHTAESVAKDLLECKTEVGQQVEKLNIKVEDHMTAFDQMNQDWQKFREDFSDMLHIFRSARGFFRVLGWIGTAAKWITAVGAVLGSFWYLLSNGHWPK